jgi:pilus assembly protein CpaE
LEPGRGLTDAIENPSRIDGLFIERAMVKANDKLAILSAEAPINQPMLTDGAAFYQLQEEMRSAFETTVIDLPRGMLVQHPHLMQDVQMTVLVTELTLASARDVIRILSWLKSNAPQTSVIVVANRVAASGPSEISRKDFESSIERKVDFIVTADAKVVTQAAKLGKTVAESSKGTKIGATLGEIVDRLAAVGDDAALRAGEESSSIGKPVKQSLLGKLGGFKSMMPKKSKAKAG